MVHPPLPRTGAGPPGAAAIPAGRGGGAAARGREKTTTAADGDGLRGTTAGLPEGEGLASLAWPASIVPCISGRVEAKAFFFSLSVRALRFDVGHLLSRLEVFSCLLSARLLLVHGLTMYEPRPCAGIANTRVSCPGLNWTRPFFAMPQLTTAGMRVRAQATRKLSDFVKGQRLISRLADAMLEPATSRTPHPSMYHGRSFFPRPTSPQPNTAAIPARSR